MFGTRQRKAVDKNGALDEVSLHSKAQRWISSIPYPLSLPFYLRYPFALTPLAADGVRFAR